MRVYSLGALIFLLSLPAFGGAQERRKMRISNATLSYSALPLVAAREWKLFQEQGLDVEIILMRSAADAISTREPISSSGRVLIVRSYSVVQTTFNDTGIPTREGIANIIRAIKAEGRFTDRNIAFEEVADPRFASRLPRNWVTKCSEGE